MAFSRTLRIIRVPLSAGVLTPIKPPAAFRRCTIGNPSGNGDLTIATDDQGTEFRVLTAGYERPLETPHTFRFDETAFWLRLSPGGTVLLEWS